MNKTRIPPGSLDRSQPIYAHLDPLVSELLATGNELAHAERWGSKQEGFVCYLAGPIDFSLIRERFDLPVSVVLSEQADLIACGLSSTTIYGSTKKWGA